MNKKNYLHNIKVSCMESCIILSAGCGMRRKYTYPESLFPIRDQLLIDHQISSIRRYNKKCQIILVTGFKSKEVIDYVHKKYKDLILIENTNYKKTTSVESLRLAMNIVVKGDVFFTYGNNLFNNYIFNFQDRNGPILIKKNERTKKSYNLGIIEQNGVLTNITYGVEQEWAETMFVPERLCFDFKQALKEIKHHEDMSHLINNFNKKYPIRISSNKKAKTVNIFKVET